MSGSIGRKVGTVRGKQRTCSRCGSQMRYVPENAIWECTGAGCVMTAKPTTSTGETVVLRGPWRLHRSFDPQSGWRMFLVDSTTRYMVDITDQCSAASLIEQQMDYRGRDNAMHQKRIIERDMPPESKKYVTGSVGHAQVFLTNMKWTWDVGDFDGV